MIFETERLKVYNAKKEDIDIIIDIENHKDNRDYLWQGSYKEHLNEINDKSHILAIVKKEKDLIGYFLAKIYRKSDVFELRRIAITEKRKGYGKELIKAIIKYAFEELFINRFWLDVYHDHLVGIRLYESLGMQKDGVLRQNYKEERGYMDQIIYSILRSEYERGLNV